MKATSALSLIVGLVFFATAAANAEEKHKIPDAPAKFLEMENPIDEDDVDERFLKKVGRLYKSKCKKCHGAEGDGQGSAAAEIEIKPTAFNVPDYLEGRKDGQLFWILKDGSEGTEMKGFGPGTEAGFSEEELWKLVTFMRVKYTK
ncbi:MAG: c-type cytochrome [Gammaproteobacteria bacterium]|nr:c-type cytochrome [Gammaproteobacteria bacterium]